MTFIAPLMRIVQQSKLALHAVLTNESARTSVFALVDQALASGTSFATTIAVGRFCGKEALGAYILANTILLFSKGIQDQLVAAPYMIYCGRRKESPAAATYAGSVLTHETIICVLASLIVGLGWLSGLLSADVSGVLFLLTFVLPVYLMREFVRSFSFAHLRHATAVRVDAIVAGLHLTGLGLMLWLGMLDGLTAVIGLGMACGVGTLLWFAFKPQKFEVELEAIKQDWRTNWSFGQWALWSQLLSCTMLYALPWILTFTHDPKETGTLGASNTITGFANLFVIGLSNYFAPRAAHAYASGGREEMLRSLRLAATTFLATIGPITLLFFLCGEWVQVVLFGAEFTGSGFIVSLLMAALFVSCFGMTAGNGLWAMERPQANFVADACSMLLMVAVTIALVPQYGALGAAWATFAGALAGTLVRGWSLRLAVIEDAAEGGAA
jgi:O-antigen/teichoic acid export membrane protein